ncbi:MAG TPA: nucleotidyltransferase family protein [Blastocatellia bacterium]|nr:nucleotidyltransferase family protein [Blastocatellia bacterium]
MSSARASTLFGELIARALAGAWRASPPPIDISTDELEKVAPLLFGSGAAALTWAKLRRSDLNDTPLALEFQQAYRLHSVQAAVHDSEIREVIKMLGAAGLEPLLVKGWAVARFYPEMGLRPYGDIDLCVRPEQYEAAAAIMSTPEGEKYNVDLHRGFEKLDEQSLDELFARSETLRLGDANVRVLKLEDQFRILCAHMLRHGAWRPLWLCDIAAITESLPSDFDWDLCLAGDRHEADWVACSVGLAHQLLEARVDDTPLAGRAGRLPSWLVPAVLKQWRRSRAIDHTPGELMTVSLRHLTRIPKALYERWPNPVQATFNLNAPFNGLPRLPFQVGDYIAQAVSFLTRLRKAPPNQQ